MGSKISCVLEFCNNAPLARLVFAISATVLIAGPAVFAGMPDAGWYPIGPPGGEAADVEADCQNPGTLYAVNPTAGIFKSTDSGDHWFLLSSRLRSAVYYQMLSPLVIDPFDPQTLYVGTRSVGSPEGRGIYKTTDGGETWRQIGPSIAVSQIVPDLRRVGVLYVSGSHRHGSSTFETLISRTFDDGETWETITLPFTTVGAPTISVAVAVDSGDSNVLYLWNSDSVYISRSGGESWTELDEAPSGTRRILASSEQPGLVLLATSHGLYRSVNSGSNWVRVIGLGEEEVTRLVEDRRTGAIYLVQNGIFVSLDLGVSWRRLAAEAPPGLTVLEPDPFDEQILYAGTEDDGVFKSSDKGATWQPTPNGYNATGVEGLFPDPALPGRLYATISSTSWPSVVSYRALIRTDDYGGHWKSLNLSKVRAVRLSPHDPSLVYALTDEELCISTDAGDTWRPPSTGLPSPLPGVLDLQVDPRRHAHAYLILNAYADSPPALYESTDDGGSWERIGPIPVSTMGYGLGILATDPPILLTASYPSFRSRDGGHNWEPIEARGIRAVIAPSDPRIVYIGEYRSDDAGENWLRIAGSPFSVDWFDPDVVYDNKYRSRDGGASWEYYAQGPEALASVPAWMVADPHEPGDVYVATRGNGAYRFVRSSGVTLHFPYLGEDTSSFTGFAVANLLGGADRIDFTAYSPSGELLPLKQNPASHVLEGNQQLARLGREIFAEDEAESVEGWIAAKSESDAGGFFLFVGDRKADGALAETGASNYSYFSRVFQGAGAFLGQKANTTIVLANPEARPAEVSLTLRGEDGQTVTTVSRIVPARGRLKESAASLFGEDKPIQSGYILIWGDPVVGFELVEFPDTAAAFGLNALRKISLGNAWSAQLANVPGMETRVRLINTLWDKPIKAVLKAMSESGQPLALPVEVEIPPYGALERACASLFKFDAGTQAIGSLTVAADSSGLVGDVVFGDLETFRLAAALPLQTEAFREALFSQVANGMGYYNGLALYNPADQPNEIRITVRNADGQVTGEATLTMPPGTRLAKLLPELVPSTAGQIRGTIRITSSSPVVAQELFGTDEFLAAVPAWPVSR